MILRYAIHAVWLPPGGTKGCKVGINGTRLGLGGRGASSLGEEP